jgi:hypothetical protein
VAERSVFALFVDVMGVQSDLVTADNRHRASPGFDRCRERLEDFHRDLDDTAGKLMNTAAGVPEPEFVAEFSDSAYVIGERFASVAIPALHLMRRALRHKYPLRGGIGVGSFSHETSGVRANRERQVWSTSSFLGSSIVTAYQAEHSTIPGLRIFIHPLVMRRNQEPYLNVYTLPLPKEENNMDASHELRLWQAHEVEAAMSRLRRFRDAQKLSERPLRHYDAAINAYERFRPIKKELPHVLPAIWL